MLIIEYLIMLADDEGFYLGELVKDMYFLY